MNEDNDCDLGESYDIGIPQSNLQELESNEIIYEDESKEMDTMEAPSAIPLPVFPDAHLLPDWKLGEVVLSSFQQDPDYVLCLADNQANKLAAASSSRTIKIYDHNLAFLMSFQSGHRQQITDLSFLPNMNSVLVSTSEDGTVTMFDCNANRTIQTFRTASSLYCCASNGEVLATGGETIITFWDLRNQQLLGSFDDFHTQDVLRLKFHPSNPSRLWSGGEDGLIAEFDLLQQDKEETIQTILNPNQAVSRFGFFGPNQQYLYCTSQIGTLHIFDTESGELVLNYDQALSRLSAHYPTHYLLDCFVSQHAPAANELFLASANHNGGVLLSHVQVPPAGGAAAVGVDWVRPVLALPGSHGTIVRDFHYNSNGVYTCGEDARLCRYTDAPVAVPAPAVSPLAPLAADPARPSQPRSSYDIAP
eukprot:TRINITY_DN3688_c0_g1_i2.p1 TRINITY_DN3688_c0_g1~~TRINITY_DN3688_c0_g1_i2.p1  ORF type:complete len:420 (+),score=95.25 TRINITY_DN3688_c0_g1_i2:57-1316(+)